MPTLPVVIAKSEALLTEEVAKGGLVLEPLEWLSKGFCKWGFVLKFWTCEKRGGGASWKGIGWGKGRRAG